MIKLPTPKFSTKVSFKTPKITFGDKERSSLFGMAHGGSAGGLIGYNYGDKLGNWSQGLWEDMTGKTARTAAEQAAKESEKKRRENIVKEFGLKQQADSTVLAGLGRGGSGGSKSSMGATNDAPGGFIGDGITSTAGTF
jgi:hypothetical protein